jgi:hypothetical protein
VAKAPLIATGRLPLLRLFSTLLVDPIPLSETQTVIDTHKRGHFRVLGLNPKVTVQCLSRR